MFARMIVSSVLPATLLCAGIASAADLNAVTADGRKVVLHEDGSWAFADDAQTGEPLATLTLENREDIAHGCRLGLRLHNALAAQVRTLVLRFTAYKAEQVPFDTVSRGYSYVKPTTSQYQEITFRGITCGEVLSVEVSAARNCHVGDLTKYSASEQRCLELIDVVPSDLLPIAKLAADS